MLLQHLHHRHIPGCAALLTAQQSCDSISAACFRSRPLPVPNSAMRSSSQGLAHRDLRSSATLLVMAAAAEHVSTS
jgi:hypothetical protein